MEASTWFIHPILVSPTIEHHASLRLDPGSQNTPTQFAVVQASSVKIAYYVSGTSLNYPAVSDPAPAGMPTDSPLRRARP